MPDTLAVMGRPKKNEPTEPLRLPESIVKRIRRLAAHKEQDPGDYVAARFGPLLDEDEQVMLDDIEREKGERSKGEGAEKPPKKPKK